MPKSWYDNSFYLVKIEKDSFYDNSCRMPKSWYDKRYVEGYDNSVIYWN